mmetsp:Transcript_21578/g.67389  ORF Transcript_21578/g.67389 Transcript_21578/m.67389 type:complete len:223 (-) Transcript_21578:67-735(-)
MKGLAVFAVFALAASESSSNSTASSAQHCDKHCVYDGKDHCCKKSPFKGDRRVVCGTKSSDWRKPEDCHTQLVAGAPGSLWDLVKRAVCDELEKGSVEHDIVNFTCKELRTEVPMVPEGMCESIAERIYENAKTECAPPSPLAVSFDSTCSAPGDCGIAYQVCCAGMIAKGFPCGCHLKNGNGTTSPDCGTCGTAYSVCCTGFAEKGYPCTCDIGSQAAIVV